jgi:hypothetical protein
MASICNDERVRFGVQGGHGRKTLSLSGRRSSSPAAQEQREPAEQLDRHLQRVQFGNG